MGDRLVVRPAASSEALSAALICEDQRMTAPPEPELSGALLRRAIVLGADEETCTVVMQEQRVEVPYADFFPRPRSERVAPGHLVAVRAVSGDTGVVVWRWFDAVVLEQVAGQVRLWEPHHGEVIAEVRDPQRALLPGSRAYLSAGLGGAEWWVAGPVVSRPEEARVELGEVQQFLSANGLWDSVA